ncbi:pyridoxal-phosphate dependent enzyme [Oceanihabitans sp.]|nr:pyridoxal-phosphate dependent enzyme [Oceanihabitans sp.]
MNSFTDKIKIKSGNHLAIRKEYLNHAFISGNKMRKLKYNLKQAKLQNHKKLLTFGGAYSNHIAAVAYAGNEYNFKTIGIIRGEELDHHINQNPTLSFAKKQGMEFKFISRAAYKEKTAPLFIDDLKKEFGDFYLLPEGGTNALAVKGCEEILTREDAIYDYICCPVGTGGTISGIINASFTHQKIIGFPALKGDFLKDEISKFAQQSNWELIQDYHFGGYAKVNTDLIAFMNQFKTENNIPLDPVYTGKMMFGIYDLISKGFFPENAKILAIHTGGLQGISGMNIVLKKRGLPLIQYIK